MDAQHFDAFVRTLLAGASRRGVLTGLLGGLLAALPGWASDESAAKKRKRRKKKKCKPPRITCGKQCCPEGQLCAAGQCREPECREDADCPDHTEACRGGSCQRICPREACPGCDFCLVRLEADGDRVQLCADEVDVPSLLQTCDTDADCPPGEPLCINNDPLSCTDPPCGICVVSIRACGEPECRVDADCPDQIESCQGGLCQPICPVDACLGCLFCGVAYESNGDRTQVCTDEFIGENPPACSTAADCPEEVECIRFPPLSSCTEPPCGFCLTTGPCRR